jgi:hypothetical protein
LTSFRNARFFDFFNEIAPERTLPSRLANGDLGGGKLPFAQPIRGGPLKP